MPGRESLYMATRLLPYRLNRSDNRRPATSPRHGARYFFAVGRNDAEGGR